MSHDSMKKTFVVAAGLCIVCSVLVSSAAVILRPMQEENRKLDIQKNLLFATGIIDSLSVPKAEVASKFESIRTKLIDFETGDEVAGIEPSSYDMKKASKDPKSNIKIPRYKDTGKNKVRSKLGKVYHVMENGRISQVVLPIYGKGLWSTLYGFLALAPDTKTIKGIGFYQHGETPGLGGEIQNPSWVALWPGKKALNNNFEPTIDVVKGSGSKENEIDGLSGATITSDGVEGLVNYWLGSHGYGAYLEKFRAGER